MIICIAGQGSIAIEAAAHILANYPEIDVVALTNDDRLSRTGWQRAIAENACLPGLLLVDEAEVYNSEDILLLALNHPMHAEASRFRSKNKFKIHFSLLPKYRGYHTSSWPILNGDLQSGTTLHLLDSGIDTGDIIDQNAFYIFGNYTARDMLMSHMEHGLRLLRSNLPSLISGHFSTRRQSISGATFYEEHSIAPERLSVNFFATAHQVSCQIRAHIVYEGNQPSLFGSKIYGVEILPIRSVGKPSTITNSAENFYEVTTTDFNVRLYIHPEKSDNRLYPDSDNFAPLSN